jgi:hypothetical protein
MKDTVNDRFDEGQAFGEEKRLKEVLDYLLGRDDFHTEYKFSELAAILKTEFGANK